MSRFILIPEKIRFCKHGITYKDKIKRKRGTTFMKNSVKKIVKTTAILLLAFIFASSPVISPIVPKATIEAEASAKSDKAVKIARKCYYTTQKNLKKYKRINSGSGCTDYWNKKHLALSVIKPVKRDILSIPGTVCEYYYSGKKLSFAFAYQKKGRKVKEYRAYYMGGKCYRYIGPDKKVHTYGSGKDYDHMSGMVKKLYHKGTYNLHFVYD